MQIPTGKYKVYHIPGIKVGCTTDIQKRVVETQGYREGEYEILFQSNDIVEASNAERVLQKDLGYKVDRQLYKDLFKKRKSMNKCTSSKATTTFKISKKDIDASFLQDIIIKNSYGEYVLDNEDKIEWVISNVHTSQFGPKTCYVYNKTMAEAEEFKEPVGGALVKSKEMTKTGGQFIFPLIREWATDRGIYDKGDSKTQYIKLQEEAGELAQALLKDDRPEIIDAIGDMVVVLTNLAALEGLHIEDCIESAYDVIINRKGKMINGTFVKNN
jgi:NTP pyrophosphatase (non-canonical NTP hydrolase)